MAEYAWHDGTHQGTSEAVKILQSWGCKIAVTEHPQMEGYFTAEAEDWIIHRLRGMMDMLSILNDQGGWRAEPEAYDLLQRLVYSNLGTNDPPLGPYTEG